MTVSQLTLYNGPSLVAGGTSRCDVPVRVRAGGTNRAPRANPAARCAARRGADGAARHPYLGRRATGSQVNSRPPPVPEGRPIIARRFKAGSEAGRTQVPTGTTEKAILARKPCLRKPGNAHSAFRNRWAPQSGRVSVLANPNFSRNPHPAFEWFCNSLWSCGLSKFSP